MPTEVAWDNATAYCLSRHPQAYLVVISNSKEQRTVGDFLSKGQSLAEQSLYAVTEYDY